MYDPRSDDGNFQEREHAAAEKIHDDQLLALRTAEALEVASKAVCRKCLAGSAPVEFAGPYGLAWMHGSNEFGRCPGTEIRAAFAQRWPV